MLPYEKWEKSFKNSCMTFCSAIEKPGFPFAFESRAACFNLRVFMSGGLYVFNPKRENNSGAWLAVFTSHFIIAQSSFFLGSMFSRDREEDQSVLKSSKMIKNERHTNVLTNYVLFLHREIFQKIKSPKRKMSRLLAMAK